MNYIMYLVVVQLFLYSFCSCDVAQRQEDYFLSEFIHYYDELPNQIYTSHQGTLLDAQQIDDDTYRIVVHLKVSKSHNPDVFKFLICTATLQDLGFHRINVLSNYCRADDSGLMEPDSQTELIESTIGRKSIQLDDKVPSEEDIILDGHVGGIIIRDPTDPKYKILAEESLQRFLKDSEIVQPHRVIQVNSVTTQIVSGLMTRIDFVASDSQASDTMSCHSEILEQPWLNKKDITVSCFNVKKLLGGITVQDPTDPEYKILAEESLHKYLIDSRIVQPHRVVQVTTVTTQVVSGSITRIDFVASNSEYTRTMTCHSEIWEQLWLNKKDIKVFCHNDNQRVKRSPIGGETKQDPTDPKYKVLAEESLHKNLLGGYTVQDPTDPKYRVLAEESLQKFLKDSEIVQPHRVIQVNSVTTQIVSGLMTRIDFVASDSQASDTMSCHSEILEQPWLNKKDITVSCFNVKKLLGGITVQDPTDPEYKILAEESLHKYLIDSRIVQPHRVVQVTTVTTQVVSGSITRIDFVASNSEYTRTMTCHSEIWEQLWLNKKDIKVFCHNDNQRVKRSPIGGETKQDPTDPKYKVLAEESLHKNLLGGYTVQDPTDPKYRVLAEESLQKFLKDSEIVQPHRVIQVNSVTTQIVSGLMTRIDFVASDSQASDTMSCHSEILEQPWLNKKDITVSCFNVKKLLGGITVQDPTDPEYKILAEESLHKYLIDSRIVQPHRVVQVTTVTTQVVSGSITRIDFVASNSEYTRTMTCHSEIWEQLWLNKKDIKVFCHNDNQRVKRSPIGGETKQDPTDPKYKVLAEESLHKNLLGGYTVQDPTDPKYRVLAEESLQKFLKDSEIVQPHRVIQVNSVTTQIVSGLMTRIDFVASDSQASDTMSCHSEILEQPWLNKKDITVSCFNVKKLLGGITVQDPTDPEYKILAEESLHKYLIDSRIVQPHRVVQVTTVTTQVVSGSITRIDFVASNSEYTRTMTCHSEIWEQLWLNKKDIKVFCHNDNQRVKRSPLGGETKQDPTDPKYRVLAEESLQKFLKDSEIVQPHRVIQVNSVTTQIVSGLMTRIDFVASDSQASDTMSCHSEILEQPWLNKKDITVSCFNVKNFLGGITVQDPTDPEYKILAEESLHKYLIDSRIVQPHRVVQVTTVTTQVVSGSMTRIDFVASNSEYTRTMTCHSEIWEQVWLNKKDITVSCHNDNQGLKEILVGGLVYQEPTEPEYKVLAEESLQKYLKDSRIVQPYRVVQVTTVSTQVVSGLMTRIGFIASNSQDSSTMTCYSKIWEQSWLNKKDITVSCHNDTQKKKK